MLRIYADFNSIDEQGRVNLNTVGSLEDVERHKAELREGLEVILYMTGELETRGVLVFDGIWKAIPDWSTVRYEDTSD